MAVRTSLKSFHSAREQGLTLSEKAPCPKCGGLFKDLQRHMREKHRGAECSSESSDFDVQFETETTSSPPVLLFPGGHSEVDVMDLAERAQRLIAHDVALLGQWAGLSREEAAISAQLTTLEQRHASIRQERQAIEDESGLAARIQILGTLFAGTQ